MNEMTTKGSERLFSLDALRGLDMMVICVIWPILMAAAKAWGFSDADAHPWMRQFWHYWGGFTFYDIVMPLFIFMSGASIPFGIGKRLDANGRPTVRFWTHLLSRVALLWVLGMVSQGELLTLDPMRISPFNNTLQTIAIGYAIATLVSLLPRCAARFAVTASLAIGYAVALASYGDYSKDGNLAQVCEQRVLSWFCPVGSAAFETWKYTWFGTIPMFGFMALCGFHATEVLRSKILEWRKAGVLVAVGVSMLAVGLQAEFLGIPCIKQIFTFSFTLQAMGWSFLALATLYVVTDIWKLRRGWWLVTLLGQTSLVAYMSIELPEIKLAVARRILFGLERFVRPEVYGFLCEVGGVAVVIFVLWVWRRARNGGKGVR